MKWRAARRAPWRAALVVLCALIGVFLSLAVPWIFQTSLERVLAMLIEAIVNELKFASRITLVSFFYPFWRDNPDGI